MPEKEKYETICQQIFSVLLINEKSLKQELLNFGTPSTNIFFALTKKICLQTLVEIIFRYH